MNSRRAAQAERDGAERSRVQQVVRVTIVEQTAFQRYAERLGLHMTTLATLLLARELRIKRLNQLAKRYGAPKGTLLDGKIVAYLQNNHVKRAFGLHAADSDMLPGPAAASILRAELAERWLERVIGT